LEVLEAGAEFGGEGGVGGVASLLEEAGVVAAFQGGDEVEDLIARWETSWRMGKAWV
jgi:hypothetical protein